MPKTYTIKSKISVGFSSVAQEDEHEIDATVWDSMSEADREKYLSAEIDDLIEAYLEVDAWVEK